MKTWWILLVTSLAGLAIGVGLALYEQQTSVELYFAEDFAARAKQLAVASERDGRCPAAGPGRSGG